MSKHLNRKQKKKMMKNAGKAPTWLRTGASALLLTNATRAFKANQGTFGPASEVRRISVEEYERTKR